MYTIVILVLFTKIKFITSVEIISRNTTKANITAVHDGIALSLGIWPLIYDKENKVVSTLPLRLALNKLAAAATGLARRELLAVLGVNDDKDLPNFYPRLSKEMHCLLESDLVMLNKFYVNQSDLVSPSFFADAFTNFGVQAEKIDFQNPDNLVVLVNQWVDSATYKRITNLLSKKDVTDSYNMILINAIHMKPTWETKFDARLSVMMPFHYHNGTSSDETRMMTALEQIFYYYDDKHYKFEVLMTYLACGRSKITYFLPYEVSGLPRLVKLLAKKPHIMKNAVKKMVMGMTNVRLPIMKIKSSMNWNAYLKGLGVNKIFNSQSSGLDSMSQGGKMNHFLGKVIQKVFIETDEFGVYRTLDHPQRPVHFIDKRIPQFVANHPFFFKVEVGGDGTPYELLSGVYYGPE